MNRSRFSLRPAAARLPRATLALQAIFVVCFPLCACVTVKPVVLDQKTQLENQILGTFEQVQQEIILVSSVRGQGQLSNLTPLQREALQAALNREFNRDEIESLKDRGELGEGNDGLIKAIAAAPGQRAAPSAARVQQLVRMENEDRMIIMRRIIHLHPELDLNDLRLVQGVFYRMHRRTARPGHRVQRKDGTWEVVSYPTSQPAPRRPR